MEVEFVEKETKAVVGEEVVITSSTSKWWSSRRLLGERLYYELYLQVVEFEAQAAEADRRLPRPGLLEFIVG